MDINYNDILAKNIQRLRKKNNLTQEDLANKFNISFQAVSKWENNTTSPDISLLPLIANEFGVSIDQLFSENQIEALTDDDQIRVLVYHGTKLITKEEALSTKAVVKLEGTPKDVISYANIEVEENLTIDGDLTNNGNLTTKKLNCGGLSCNGDIESEQMNCGGVTVDGNINTERLSSGGITVKGDMKADTISSGGIICKGEIQSQKITCDGTMSCDGDIVCEGKLYAKIINGNRILKNKKDMIVEIDVNEIHKFGKGITTNSEEKKLQDKLEDLQEEIDDLQEEYDELEEEYDELKEKYNNLKSSLSNQK